MTSKKPGDLPPEPTVEIFPGPRRAAARRVFSAKEKQQYVEEASQPGSSVSAVARPQPNRALRREPSHGCSVRYVAPLAPRTPATLLDPQRCSSGAVEDVGWLGGNDRNVLRFRLHPITRRLHDGR